jgi:GNAT superfamily N-acetyltransferase
VSGSPANTGMQLSDGYTDLPPGKIANVVTCLEMREPPSPRPDPPDVQCSLHRAIDPDNVWYRALFRRVGEPYLWSSRLTLSDEQLTSALRDPNIEIYSVRSNGADEGLIELDFRTAGECELLFFGLTDALVGKGIGRWAMNRALEIAWSHPIARFWVHTCTLDHPSAVGFYIRSGFRPFKRQIEILDDPRAIGVLPREAAPEVPLL